MVLTAPASASGRLAAFALVLVIVVLAGFMAGRVLAPGSLAPPPAPAQHGPTGEH